MAEPDDETEAPRWQHSQRVVSRDLPNGVLLLAPTMAEPLALIGPASSLWGLLAGEPTRLEVVAALARVYGTTPQQVDTDIATAWDDLVASGLIEPAPATATR